MKTKNLAALFLLAILIPLSQAVMCEDRVGVGQNCTMISPPISCDTYSIFLKNGSMVENGTMTQISQYFYQVNFSQAEGDYYVVLCDNVQSREIRVTSEDESKMIVAITILLPIIFGIILLVGGISLGSKHTPIKFFCFFLSIISFWVAMHFALVGVTKFYNFPELQELIGTTAYWTVWVFIVIISYFIIYVIYLLVQGAAQKKKERLEF